MNSIRQVHIPIKGLDDMKVDCVVVHFREQSFDLRVYAPDGTVGARVPFRVLGFRNLAWHSLNPEPKPNPRFMR